MAVVPADELGRRVGAGELFTGYAQGPVGGRAGGIDDRVVVGEQILTGDVLAEMDVAEEPEARVHGGLLVHAGDRLDLRVVGRDARADESPWRRQALEHVDLEAVGGDLQQVSRGVEAGGTRADDRNANGGIVGHRGRWAVGAASSGRGTGGGWARPDSN